MILVLMFLEAKLSFIEKVGISGFWGSRNISFKFDKDVNFIIGVNGSGKTTAVNLIVAALKCDFAALDKIEFSKIEISVGHAGTKKKSTIEVKKQRKPNLPFSGVSYEVVNALAGSNKIVFSLDDYEEQYLLRGISSYVMDRERFRKGNRAFVGAIEEIVNVSWLSVNRASSFIGESDSKKYESTVDLKLVELSNRLVRYFAGLGKKGAALLEEFQKTVFLSLLVGREDYSAVTSKHFDYLVKKEMLAQMFEQFKFSKSKYVSVLDNHFDLLGSASKKIVEKDVSGISSMEAAALIGAQRIDGVVKEWMELVSQRNAIFEPRDSLLSIINELVQRKKFRINDSSELEVVTQSGKVLKLTELSSGEKQLIIVLGEALLQEKKEWVYIADEPEISLHVSWQASLVDNLRKINPNAQIIFATHSPDVVGHYNDKEHLIDMEGVLS